MTDELLTLRQLNRATLARQMLLAREAISVTEAIERLVGMQAQEARPPFIGLWTRLNSFGIHDLSSALHSRQVVRATMMRGTLHAVTAQDYAAFRMVLQPMLTQGMRVLGDRANGLDLERLIPAARACLRDGPLTFDELRGLLSGAFPDVHERALGYATRMNLPLVMVPTANRWGFPSVSAFTLAETWLSQPLSHDPSPETLVSRYLAAFGPATVADAQTWSGLSGLKSVLQSMRQRLRVFRDERGRELFDLPDAPRPDGSVVAPVRFLPEFDNLLLAHSDRTRVIADEHRGQVVTKNLRVHATFLLDGLVAGTWRIERKKGTATLHIKPFESYSSRDTHELTDEGERLLRFVEDDATNIDIQLESPTMPS